MNTHKTLGREGMFPPRIFFLMDYFSRKEHTGKNNPMPVIILDSVGGGKRDTNLRTASVMKTHSPPPSVPSPPTISKSTEVKCQIWQQVLKISVFEDMNLKSCTVQEPAKAIKLYLKIQKTRKERVKQTNAKTNAPETKLFLNFLEILVLPRCNLQA